jgi:hypothetical protein
VPELLHQSAARERARALNPKPVQKSEPPMAEKMLPGKPNDSLSLSKTEQTLKSSNENEGDFKVSGAKAWDEFLLALAETHGHALSKMQLIMYSSAVSHLTDEQRTRGANWLNRNANYFPNPAECVQACTGIPGGSTTIATAISTEAKRFWGWMIKWTPRLVEGYRVELTIAPYSKTPVTHKFAARCLGAGIAPYWVQPRNVNHDDVDQRRHEVRLAEAARDAYESEDGPSEESCKQYNDAVAEAKQKLEAAEAALQSALKAEEARVTAAWDARVFCRLLVEMPPKMSAIREEILSQLGGTAGSPHGGTPGAGIQAFVKFLKSGDSYLDHNFREKAEHVIGEHAKEDNHALPSRQLTGAVRSENEPRVYRGLIQLRPEGTVAYYAIETLRQAQANGVPVTDQDIADQETFIANLDEIWTAPYPAPKVAPKATQAREPWQGITGDSRNAPEVKTCLTSYSHDETMAIVNRAHKKQEIELACQMAREKANRDWLADIKRRRAELEK